MHPTTIIAVDARPLDLSLTEPFAIATGVHAQARNVVVEITLADGTRGRGEGAPLTAVDGHTQESVLSTVEDIGPWLIGQTGYQWRKIGRTLAERWASEGVARCALEMALLDALTRHWNTPLFHFFGGVSDRVCTDMTITAGDREHAQTSALAIVNLGITTLKVKVGAHDPDTDIGRLEAIVSAAPTARLLADANGGYSEEEARYFIDHIIKRSLPLEVFEQPVPRESWDSLLALAQDSPIPVCADESARSSQDVWSLIQGGVPAVNIKLMKCGVVDALRMWEVCTLAERSLMIGGMVESRLAMGFSAHFAAGLGGFRWVDLDTPLFVADNPFSGGYSQRGGAMVLDSAKAGHGVEVNEPVLQ